MEKEMDLSIARFVKAQWEKEQEEEDERKRRQYDPKEKITYTLDELMEGIRKGWQYLYTLRMEFEPRQLLAGRITIPYVKNFFDVDDDEPETAFLGSNKRKVSFNVSDSPGKKFRQPLGEWIAQTKEGMKKMHLHIKPERKRSVGNMEYFCFVVPASGGHLYNIMFRIQKGDRICVGAYNCPEEEREGMGLMLEAMVCMIEEMNR